MCVCIYVCICVSIYIHIYIYRNIYIYIYLYLYGLGLRHYNLTLADAVTTLAAVVNILEAAASHQVAVLLAMLGPQPPQIRPEDG